MSLPDRLLVAAVLISALWWACSRHRQPAALQRLSAVALVLAAATVIFDGGPRWQLVLWQGLAVGVALAAALRYWRRGRSRRAVRILGRGALAVGVFLGAMALMTAVVPQLPKPSGSH